MRTMSPAFRRAIFDGRADYTNYLEFTFADETTLSLDNESIMMDGCKMEDAVSDENVFQVGAVIVNSATFTLNNMDEALTNYPYEGAQVVWYVGMDDLDDETSATIGNGAVKMGTFYVDEVEYDGHIITLRCLDNAGKLDIPFVWPNSIPLTGMCSLEVGSWITQVSTQSGVSIPNAWSFSPTPIYYEYGHVAYSSIESATCRQVLSWVLQLCGRFARCNADGQLMIGWFDTSALTPSGSLYGGYFDETEQSTYQSGDDADGGSFNPWNTGYAADGGDFTTYQNIDMIHNCFSQKLDMSDITITGVRIVYKTGDGGSSGSVAEATTGTGDYMISIEDNPFISAIWGMYPVNCALSWIGSSVIGMKFRAGEVVHPSDPSIEAGDVGYYWDTHGNQHSILISSTEFKCGVTQRTCSSAASTNNNASVRYSNNTKNYSEIMGIINGSYIKNQLSSAGMYKTDTIDASAINGSFTNTGHGLSARIEKINNTVTLTGSMKTGSNISAQAYIAMFRVPSGYSPRNQIFFKAYKEGGAPEVTFYMDPIDNDWVRLLAANSVVASATYLFTVSYTMQ